MKNTKSTKVISIGPESCGTRWAARCAAFLCKAPDWENWHAKHFFPLKFDDNIIDHFSWPSGGRSNFPLIDKYKDYKIILCTRDSTASLLSVLKYHDDFVSRAIRNQQKALKLCNEVLCNPDLDVFLFSYETAVNFPQYTLREMSKWLEVGIFDGKIPEKLVAKDGNAKYFKKFEDVNFDS